MKLMKRKLWYEMEEWLQYRRNIAYCIIGARKTGKATLAEHFAEEHFDQVLRLNFMEDPDAVSIFEGDLRPDHLYPLIASHTGQKIEDGNVLLLMEEVQECPNTRTAVKFLAEDGRCAIIETISMAGVNMGKVRSYPVGFEEQHHLYPLDFEEFLWAMETDPKALKILKECFQSKTPLPDALHQSMLEMYKQYLVVGGMPEVVIRYKETNSMEEVAKLQKQILNLYHSDIQKYADPMDKTNILQMFYTAPVKLKSQNPRYKVSRLLSRGNKVQILMAMFWLSEAGLIHFCYGQKKPRHPLNRSLYTTTLKLFFLDPGLLCMALQNSDPSLQDQILHENTDGIFEWFLENAAACQLKANGFELFSCSSKRVGMLDLILSIGLNPSMVQIESSANTTKDKALKQALNVKNWFFNTSYIFGSKNVQVEWFESDNGKQHKIVHLPYYMTMFLTPDMERDPALDHIPSIDWSKIEIPTSYSKL